MAEQKSRIYIDAYSGNWGDADGIVTLLVTDKEQDALFNMSDEEIMAFALKKAEEKENTDE